MGLFQDLFGTPKPNIPNTSNPLPTSEEPERLDLRDGVFESETRFNPNFKHRVAEDLKGTLKDFSTRNIVADLFYESRGGVGITKQEIKDGLISLVRQKKITEDQMWAVRNKYGIY